MSHICVDGNIAMNINSCSYIQYDTCIEHDKKHQPYIIRLVFESIVHLLVSYIKTLLG